MKMGLTNAKEDQLRKMPVIESSIRKSKDGKWIIHKTIITDFKPVAYYEKVVADLPESDAEVVQTTQTDSAKVSAE